MGTPRARFFADEARSVQVAAVCFRRQEGSTRFLLVRTSSGRWTFPKGHLEDRLSLAEVAALEAFEEGGVDGEVDAHPVGTYLHRKESLGGSRAKDISVIAFLLEAKDIYRSVEEHRRPRWFTAADAKRRLAYGRSARYLRTMERIIDSALLRIARKGSSSSRHSHSAA